MSDPRPPRRVGFRPESTPIGAPSPEQFRRRWSGWLHGRRGCDQGGCVSLIREGFQAIADTANDHGLRVPAHVQGPGEERHALAAGVPIAPMRVPPVGLIRDVVVAGRPVVITGAHRVRLPLPWISWSARGSPVGRGAVCENLPTLPYCRTPVRSIFPATLRRPVDRAGCGVGNRTDSGTPGNFPTEALRRERKAREDPGMIPREAIVAVIRGMPKSPAWRTISRPSSRGRSPTSWESGGIPAPYPRTG